MWSEQGNGLFKFLSSIFQIFSTVSALPFLDNNAPYPQLQTFARYS